MRRLDGLIGGFFVALLVPLGGFFAWVANENGILPVAASVAGTVALALASLWIALVEPFFPGLDRLRVTRGLLTAGIALQILSLTAVPLDSPLAWAIRAAAGITTGWSFFEIWLSTRGPERPRAFPLAVFQSVYRGVRKAPVLEGSVEGLPLTIEYSRDWRGTTFEDRTLPCSSSRDLELGPVTLLGSFRADQPTGDAAFDAAVQARGPRATTLAHLRAPARAALMEVIKAGGTLSDGILRGDRRVEPALLARVAHALALDSVMAGLLVNIANDPVPEVRLASLDQLVISDLGGTQSREGCRTAIRDADPRVRVLAASHLLLAGDADDKTIAEEALAASTVGLGAVVAGLLEKAEGTTAEALLRVLAARGGPDAQPALDRFLARAEGSLKKLAATALVSVVERAAAGRGRVSLSDQSDAGALSITNAGGLTLPVKTKG